MVLKAEVASLAGSYVCGIPEHPKHCEAGDWILRAHGARAIAKPAERLHHEFSSGHRRQ